MVYQIKSWFISYRVHNRQDTYNGGSFWMQRFDDTDMQSRSLFVLELFKFYVNTSTWLEPL